MQRIALSGRLGAGLFALVDDADVPLVTPYSWSVIPAKHTMYAKAWIRGEGRVTYMHILIMGRPYIDHWDGDGLNNQRANLRPATQSQNLANKRFRPGGTSRFKGVYRGAHAWIALITVDYRKRHLGCFATEEEAARAYDAAAREAWGEFARPNFPA